MRARRCPLLGGLLLVLAGAARAQEETIELRPQPLPAFGDRIDVVVGNLEVTVFDRDGRPVRGLGAADFRLVVDGAERPLSNFAAPPPAAQPAAPEATAPPTETEGERAPALAPSPIALPRPGVLVVVVDSENMAIFNRNHLLTRASGFVRGWLRPPDAVAVFEYARGMRRICDLTSDPERVAAAFDELGRSTSGTGALLSIQRMAADHIRELADCTRCALAEDQAKLTANGTAAQVRNSLQATVKATKALVRALSGVPGRKAILYLSDGLPMAPGLDTFYLLMEYFPLRSAQTDKAAFDASPLFKELAAYAAAAEVTLHAIDARGVVLDDGKAAEHASRQPRTGAALRRYRDLSVESNFAVIRSYQEPLQYMAEVTGGLAVINSNDFEGALAGIGEAVAAAYSLGFELEPEPAPRSHAIRVELPNHPELRPRYRSTLVQRPAAARMEERVLAGLAFDLTDNPLAVTATAGIPRPAGRKRWIIPVTVGVPLTNLVLTPVGGDLLGAVTVSYAAGVAGRHSAIGRVRIPLRLPAAALAQPEELSVVAEAEVEEGDVRISVAALDETAGVAGYARADLRLPPP